MNYSDAGAEHEAVVPRSPRKVRWEPAVVSLLLSIAVSRFMDEGIVSAFVMLAVVSFVVRAAVAVGSREVTLRTINWSCMWLAFIFAIPAAVLCAAAVHDFYVAIPGTTH